MDNIKIKAASRRLLISVYNRNCNLEPSACAYELTQFCIKNKIVANRKPIPGQALKEWATGSPVPLWGVLGAYKVLILTNYKPCCEKEQEAFNEVSAYIEGMNN